MFFKYLPGSGSVFLIKIRIQKAIEYGSGNFLYSWRRRNPPQIVGVCDRVELVLFLGIIVLMEVASHRLSLTRLLTTGLLSLLGRGEILFLFNFCQPDKNALLWIQTYYILIRIWILGLCHQSLKKKKKWIIRKKHFFKKIFFLTKENTVMAPEEILVGWVSCTWSVV